MTLLWAIRKPRTAFEIRAVQRRLIEARKKHRRTKHLEAQLRAITTFRLREETQRFQ